MLAEKKIDEKAADAAAMVTLIHILSQIHVAVYYPTVPTHASSLTPPSASYLWANSCRNSLNCSYSSCSSSSSNLCTLAALPLEYPTTTAALLMCAASRPYLSKLLQKHTGGSCSARTSHAPPPSTPRFAAGTRPNSRGKALAAASFSNRKAWARRQVRRSNRTCQQRRAGRSTRRSRRATTCCSGHNVALFAWCVESCCCKALVSSWLQPAVALRDAVDDARHALQQLNMRIIIAIAFFMQEVLASRCSTAFGQKLLDCRVHTCSSRRCSRTHSIRLLLPNFCAPKPETFVGNGGGEYSGHRRRMSRR